jgi:hypothetical protein
VRAKWSEVTFQRSPSQYIDGPDGPGDVVRYWRASMVSFVNWRASMITFGNCNSRDQRLYDRMNHRIIHQQSKEWIMNKTQNGWWINHKINNE